MTDAATPEAVTVSEVHELASAAGAIETVIRRVRRLLAEILTSGKLAAA